MEIIIPVALIVQTLFGIGTFGLCVLLNVDRRRLIDTPKASPPTPNKPPVVSAKRKPTYVDDEKAYRAEQKENEKHQLS